MSIKLVRIEDWDGIGPAAALPHSQALVFKELCDTTPDRIALLEKWLTEDQERYGLNESGDW